jgi:hypothetical protein
MVNNVNMGEDGAVIRAPGASLKDSGSALARGAGAAAAGSIAGVLILTSMTIADIKARLDGTRHGRTLAELFTVCADRSKDGERGGPPVALTIAVQSGSGGASEGLTGFVGAWRRYLMAAPPRRA